MVQEWYKNDLMMDNDHNGIIMMIMVMKWYGNGTMMVH
jgi:hypothetical protein